MSDEQKRILVVDDEPSITRLLKLNLEQTGDYLVRTENDSKASLAAAEEFHPDLILLDVMMPGLDGGNLAGALQANARLKDVPIVFLTAAVTRAEVRSRQGRIGGLPFLAKPVNLQEVLACLQHHLGSAHAPAASARPAGYERSVR
jgi:two-component system, OmpR family, response regulator